MNNEYQKLLSDFHYSYQMNSLFHSIRVETLVSYFIYRYILEPILQIMWSLNVSLFETII